MRVWRQLTIIRSERSEREQIADGQHEPAIELAQEIKQAQEAEIMEMQQILATL